MVCTCFHSTAPRKNPAPYIILPETPKPIGSDEIAANVPKLPGLLRRLDQDGTGADRQRALFASGLPPPGFVQALARATLSHSM